MKPNNCIVPLSIEDILNYKVSTNIYTRSNNSNRTTTCNIYELLQIMAIDDEFIVSTNIYGLKQQILFIHFYDVNMNSVLEFAMKNNLTPTFVVNGNNYTYRNELCSGEDFTFVYFLNEPITNDALMSSIDRHLETIFQPQFPNCEVGCYTNLDMTDVDITNNFINIIISHNVYVPVRGGI